ncbi:MAG TPA: AIM24 family protein [Solirubrobacterales bacterium]
MTNPAPDWYPDPEDPTQLRYWDGNAWTENRAPGPGAAAQPQAPAPQQAPPQSQAPPQQQAPAQAPAQTSAHQAKQFDEYAEIESGEAFTRQNSQLLKIELSETTVMARNGAMVGYQGNVSFEHQGGGLGRFVKKAATGEQLRLMKASGTGELFLANQAMKVHVISLENETMTVNGQNILAFQAGIDWNVTRTKGGAAGVLAGGLFNIGLTGTGLVALCSDGDPIKLDIGEAPTFADPQAAIAWSGGVQTQLKTEIQAKSLIGMGSGESFQIGFVGQGWVLIQPSEGRPVVATG